MTQVGSLATFIWEAELAVLILRIVEIDSFSGADLDGISEALRAFSHSAALSFHLFGSEVLGSLMWENVASFAQTNQDGWGHLHPTMGILFE